MSDSPYEGFVVGEVCEELRSPDGKGGYNRGQAFDLLANAGWDDPEHEIDDLKEAVYYLQKEIERLEFKKTLATQLESEPMVKTMPTPAPLRISYARLQCPVCLGPLRESSTERGSFGCLSRGHGWVRFKTGQFYGDWMGSVPKVKSTVGFCVICGCEIDAVECTNDGVITTYKCVNNHVSNDVING